MAVTLLAVGLLGMITSCTAPPVAALDEDTVLAGAGQTVQFSDKSTGEVKSRQWDFGDGGSSTEQNPSHIYDQKGSYNVTLSVTNGGGNSQASMAINVLEPCKSEFTASKKLAATKEMLLCVNLQVRSGH
jgi:PKD repeat protein